MKSRNKKREKMNQLTVCTKHKTLKKPSIEDTKLLQTKCMSEVLYVTPNQLANLLTTGYSVHAAVCDLKTDNRTKATQKTFKKECFLYQNIFMLDIDHGNFTQEEIIHRSVVSPTIVYQSFSSKEEAKRWRVVYFSETSINDNEKCEQINRLLMTPFLDNCDVFYLENADIKTVDVTRLFYAGRKKGLYIDMSAYFCPITLLEDKQLHRRCVKNYEDVKALIRQKNKRALVAKKAYELQLIDKEEYDQFILVKNSKIITEERFLFLKEKSETYQNLIANNKKELKAKRVRESQELKAVVDTKTGELIELETTKTFSELKTLVFENLKNFKPVGVKEMTYREAINFLKTVPLNELLNVSLNESFPCLFHDDHTPSAQIFRGKDGTTVYHCFSSSCGVNISTFNFLMLLVRNESNNLRSQNVEKILRVMDVRLKHSQFELLSSFQLMESVRFISSLSEKDELKRKLMKKNLHDFYYSTVQYAHMYISDEPLTKVGENVVVHVSVQKLFEFMRSNKVKGTSDYHTFYRKLRFLNYLGMITVVEHSRLKGKVLHETISCKKSGCHKLKSFYEFPIIDDYQWEIIGKQFETFEKTGLKMHDLTTKNLALLFGVEEAKKVFVQNKNIQGLSEIQTKVFNQMTVAVPILFSKKSYFTYKQLMAKVDPKCKLYKTATERREEGLILIPLLKKEMNLDEKTVNQRNRKKYKISVSVKDKMKVFVKSDSRK